MYLSLRFFFLQHTDTNAHTHTYIYIYIYKKLLSDKRINQLNCPTEDLNTCLRDNLSDPSRDKELGHLEAVIMPHLPTTKFDLEEPSCKEVRDVVKAARSASAPGHSRIPYGVYKRCPGLLQLLWGIIKVIWWSGRVAESMWVLKGENSREQFKSIFCWILKAKSFTAFVLRRLSKYNYSDIQYKKAGFKVFQDVLNILESLPRYWGKPEMVGMISAFCNWTSRTHTVPSRIN